MRRMIVIWGCVAGACVCEGRTITVDDDGPADFNNIQAAIDDGNDGDTVLIADGTYGGNGNRDIDFLGKAITVRSANGPQNCIIDCNGTEEDPHRGFYFHNAEGPNSILAGLTITNGYGHYEQIMSLMYSVGGAIYCYDSSPTISDCTMTRNSAEFGGAIACMVGSGRPTISHSILVGNSADSGGAIWCDTRYGGLTLRNCLVVGNSANYDGGGRRGLLPTIRGRGVYLFREFRSVRRGFLFLWGPDQDQQLHPLGRQRRSGAGDNELDQHYATYCFY